MKKTAILLLSCPDKKGIVAEVSNFAFRNNGNIIYSSQYTEQSTKTYFMRIQWELEGFKIPESQIKDEFLPLAKRFHMDWQLHFSRTVSRMAIFVSKVDHCLYDILIRHKAGEFEAEIPLVVSNHQVLKPIADYFGIDFYHFPVDNKSKKKVEEAQLKLMDEYQIDLIILARYMQILPGHFVNQYHNRIINVHHSFLPAFTGKKPYHQAYLRGVKIIGATSHYVIESLDQGPIIDQDVVKVSHNNSIEDLIIKGKNLEKVVLANAVKKHLENKILVFNNKTVVFD